MTHERVSELDATFLGYSQLSIGAIVLDPPPGGQAPTFEQLTDAVDAHLRRSPSFRQRLRAVPLHVDRPIWVDDESFDLRSHLHRIPLEDGEEVSLSQFAELAAQASRRHVDRAHAPWQLEIVEPMEGGRLGLIASVDHVRADGIGALIFFTLLLSDLPGEAPSGSDNWKPEPQLDDLRLVLEALSHRFSAFEHRAVDVERRVRSRDGIASLVDPMVRDARQLPSVAAYVRRGRRERVEPAPFNRAKAQEVGLAFRDRPLAPTATAAKALVPGATVNDAMLAGVAAGLGDWLAAAGEPARDLRVLMPVDVLQAPRTPGGPANRATRSFLRLPVTEPDPVERLRLVRARTQRVKRDQDAKASLALARLLGHPPQRLSGPVRRWVDREVESFNVVVSDFKGPDAPLTLLGCPLRLIFPLTTLTGHNGVNVTVTSMRDRLCYSVMVNGQVIEDPGVIAAGVDRTLDDLEERPGAPGPA